MARRTIAFLLMASVGCRKTPPVALEEKVAVVDAGATATVDARAEAPPPELACLALHYVGTVSRREGGWVLVLPDEKTLVWDDRVAKTLERKLEAPDLEDIFSIPYPRGPIVPIVDPNHDPGRIRSTELLEATYGSSREAVRRQLVPWTFRGKTLVVHARAKSAFDRVAARLTDPDLAVWFEGMGGTFNWRPIAGTDRPSAHSFGISLDLNPAKSHYWRNDPKAPWKSTVPEAIVRAFEAEGFVWGGRWFHYDTMHFEWRPELFCFPPHEGN